MATCVSPCDAAKCIANTTCVGVDPSTGCTPKPGSQTTLSAKCTPLCFQKKDPCLNQECPQGQSCRLNYTLTKSSCTVTAYCWDVCFGYQCPCEEFCYSDIVQCFRAPCYNVPKCQKPCDTLNCTKGSKCAPVPYNIDIPCTCPPCSPRVYCRATGTPSPPPYNG